MQCVRSGQFSAQTIKSGVVGSNNSKTPNNMIKKLNSGKYRLYSRKLDKQTGKRRNLGTFSTRGGAEKHERAVQYFKRAH